MEPAQLKAEILILGRPGVGQREFAGIQSNNLFSVKDFVVEGKSIRLQFDTAPRYFEPLETLQNHFSRKKVVVIMYDVTIQETFNTTKRLLDHSNSYAIENARKILVGNFCELTSRKVVDYNAAKEFAENNGIYFTEISTTTNQGVDQLKQKIAEFALAVLENRPDVPQTDNRDLRPVPQNHQEISRPSKPLNRLTSLFKSKSNIPSLLLGILLIASFACGILFKKHLLP